MAPQVATPPPALKRGVHVMQRPEPTTVPVHNTLDTQVSLDQSVDQYVEEFIAAYPF